MMLLALILCIAPVDSCARDTFDQIEIQAVYSWCEKPRSKVLEDQEFVLKLTFTQILLRNWCDRTGTHEIDAWRMAKPCMAYQRTNGVHEIRWIDGSVERVVRTKSLVYSATDLDSEVHERERYPKEIRRELTALRAKGRE